MDGDNVAIPFGDRKVLSKMSVPFALPVANEDSELRQISHDSRGLREYSSVACLRFGRVTGRPRAAFLGGIDVYKDGPAFGWAAVTFNSLESAVSYFSADMPNTLNLTTIAMIGSFVCDVLPSTPDCPCPPNVSR